MSADLDALIALMPLAGHLGLVLDEADASRVIIRLDWAPHLCTTGGIMHATARGEDGVIETIERVDGRGWAVGMQWHNELMWRHDERFLRPFQDLVEAARAYAG